eukprot:sb/3462663/
MFVEFVDSPGSLPPLEDCYPTADIPDQSGNILPQLSEDSEERTPSPPASTSTKLDTEEGSQSGDESQGEEEGQGEGEEESQGEGEEEESRVDSDTEEGSQSEEELQGESQVDTDAEKVNSEAEEEDIHLKSGAEDTEKHAGAEDTELHSEEEENPISPPQLSSDSEEDGEWKAPAATKLPPMPQLSKKHITTRSASEEPAPTGSTPNPPSLVLSPPGKKRWGLRPRTSRKKSLKELKTEVEKRRERKEAFVAMHKALKIMRDEKEKEDRVIRDLTPIVPLPPPPKHTPPQPVFPANSMFLVPLNKSASLIPVPSNDPLATNVPVDVFTFPLITPDTRFTASPIGTPATRDVGPSSVPLTTTAVTPSMEPSPIPKVFQDTSVSSGFTVTIPKPVTVAPGNASAIFAPNSGQVTVAPSNTPATVAPSNASAIFAPGSVPATVAPSNTPLTVAPNNASAIFTPSTASATVGPSNASATVAPNNTSTTVASSNASAIFARSKALLTVTLSNTLKTVAPSNVPAKHAPSKNLTTLAPRKTPSTVAPSNVPATLAPSNVPETLAPGNASATVVPSKTPIKIAPNNVPTTVAPSNTPATGLNLLKNKKPSFYFRQCQLGKNTKNRHLARNNSTVVTSTKGGGGSNIDQVAVSKEKVAVSNSKEKTAARRIDQRGPSFPPISQGRDPVSKIQVRI